MPALRIEPRTSRLWDECSTTELWRLTRNSSYSWTWCRFHAKLLNIDVTRTRLSLNLCCRRWKSARYVSMIWIMGATPLRAGTRSTRSAWPAGLRTTPRARAAEASSEMGTPLRTVRTCSWQPYRSGGRHTGRDTWTSFGGSGSRARRTKLN